MNVSFAPLQVREKTRSALRLSMFQHGADSMEDEKFPKVGTPCGNISLRLTTELLPREVNFDSLRFRVMYSVGDSSLTSSH